MKTLRVLVEVIAGSDAEIAKHDTEISRRAKQNELASRLMTLPGIGPLIATAITVPAPRQRGSVEGATMPPRLALYHGSIRRAKAASRSVSQRLAATTKIDEYALRRLLILEVESVNIKRHVDQAARPVARPVWKLPRKQRMLVRAALANRWRGSSGP